MKIPISKIQNTHPRREHGDIEGLKESIVKVGLINPITIDEENNILAGRRRFQAIKELEWVEVEVRIVPINGNKLRAFKIAIDENLKRKPLTNPEVASVIKEYDELARQMVDIFNGTQNAIDFQSGYGRKRRTSNNY